MACQLFLNSKKKKQKNKPNDTQYFPSHESYTKFKCKCPQIKFYCTTAMLKCILHVYFPATVRVEQRPHMVQPSLRTAA